MVALAAKLRELAQIRNAGNNLTLKAVVLQPTYVWPAAMLSAWPRRAPDGAWPRGCRKNPAPSVNALVAGRLVRGGWPPRLQTRGERRTGN